MHRFYLFSSISCRPNNNAGRIGMCPCVDVNWSRNQARNEERLVRQANRRKMKEERQKRRQKKLSRKRAMVESHNGQCNYEKMNCFSHDKDHWRTAPLWNDTPFCVCMNANNNTYWCVRTLNTTHNSLYCEFITGFVTYYDMRIDPYQLRNIAHTLSENQLAFFHATLERLRVCKGADCFVNTHPSAAKLLAAGKSDPEEGKDASYHLQSSHLLLDNGYVFSRPPRAARLSSLILSNCLFPYIFAGGRVKSNRDVTDTGAGRNRSGAKGRRPTLRHRAPPRD